MDSNFLAVGFALASALTIAWGTVVRHRSTKHSPGQDPYEQSPISRAIRKPLWWISLSTATFGYFLQLVALGYGTLLIVQPLLVLSLMFTFPITAYYERRPMMRDEVLWALILTVAVATLVVLGNPSPGTHEQALGRWWPYLLGGLTIAVVAFRLSFRCQLNMRGLILGAVTGLNYGFVALFSKATVDHYYAEGMFGLLTSWQLYILIVLAVAGTVVQQYAFAAGALRLSLPAMTVVEPIVAFSLGYAILGESFQVSGWNWVIMGGAVVLMLLATFALANRADN